MKHARSRVFTFLGRPLQSKRSKPLITFGVCFALLLTSVSSLWSTTATANYVPGKKRRAQGNASTNAQDRRVAPLPPRPGPPAANLPNLDELRASDANRRPARSPEPQRPVPSTMRSRRKARWLTPENRSISGLPRSLQPYARPTETQVRAHHVSAKSYLPRSVTSPPIPPPPDTRINHALASNGGAASASSTLPPGSGGPGTYWSASALNNGDRKGTNWGYGGGWADASSGSFPDWLQIDFNGSKIIDEINLFTIQDNFPNPSEPTQTTIFNVYGVTGYEVQYWNGSSWVGIAGGIISGNNKVWRQITFAAVTTSKIRVNIVAAIDNGYSRMTEIEAWGNGTPSVNVAAAANGATATASSILNANFPPSGVINGDRKGLNWGNGGGWADASSGSFPDWVQIDFNGSKTISEIDLFTLQNNYTYPADPTESMTFSTWGVSGYSVEYWNGSSWTQISEGQITGNNKVWRKITFSPLTTTRIRVKTTAAIDNGYSRLTEIEAWSISANDSGNLSDFAMARLDPQNRTGTGGEDLLSNNFNWSLPIVSLPGRSGLDLGLALSYNSLVWTRAGSSIDFDIDDGSIAPGFRLGFPVVEGPYWNSQANANFYLLVTPSGGRTELRQITNSIYYEAVDSSHLQLTDNASIDGTILLRTTDGSQLRFNAVGGGWRCAKITDRNGNYISATYKSWGELETVTDTLGRVLTFNYDSNSNLQSITQTWAGQMHEWATFGWGTATIGNNFPGLNNLGPNSTTIPVLTQVSLPDASRYNFEYANSYGMVSKIRHHASDNRLRRQTTYVAPANASDCPRLSAQRDWAENWNGDTGDGVAAANEEAATSFGHDADNGCRVTLPDGTVYKQYYGSSWQSGLTTETRSYATVADANSNAWQKKTTTSWTQDNPNVGYLTNPRVVQVDVEDSSGNHRRTAIDYGAVNLGYVQWGLPHIVREYGVNGATATEFRRSQTDYNLSQPYLDRRIIGLVSSSQLYDAVAAQWQAKVTYGYDATAINSQATTAVMHEQSYNASFTVRGNATVVSRWDVTDINNAAKALTTTATYNAAGSMLSTTDPATHTNSLSYADSFSDGNNARNTFAYPTTLTDADGFSSFMQYNFDFSAKTRAQGPPPQNQPNGIIQTFAYDAAARLERVTTLNNGAYTHYDYGPYWMKTHSSVNSVSQNYLESDLYTFQLFDGAGRVFWSVSNHPGSTGGYRAVINVYDQMGRTVQQSNPTEIDHAGIPAGDDQAGWQYNLPTLYDWQGRPRKTYNMDGTYKEASYSSCGCAGSTVVTLTDEVGRRQKVYSDVLGRTWKSEVLNWDGTVYSTTTHTFNARDQVTLVRQFAETDQSQTYQDTTMSYDGYGRLKTKHAPEQQVDPNNPSSSDHTTWAYKLDDMIESVTDARGASATYGYNNNRHLVNTITYSAPTGITPTSNVTFGYDAAGNRTSMTDGSGTTTYQYNSLSQMTSETRAFAGLSGSFTLAYEYALSGAVKKVTDQHVSTSFTTSFDNSGRVSDVSAIQLGGGFVQYASQAQYRATGALKSIGYGNSTSVAFNYDNRGLVTSYSLSGAKSSGTPKVIGDSYQYYNDGAVKFAQDQASTNSIIDRAYQYDHASRLKEAYSGTEARDFVNNTSIGTTDGPYRQTNTYDAWDNTLTSGGRLWSRSVTDTASYNEFNRNPNWIYDAEGNLLSRNEMMGNTGSATSSYDAAGRRTRVAQMRPCWLEPQHLYQLHVYANTQTYDGDGQMSRYEQSHRIGLNGPHGDGSPKITYYLRSTVLGGRVISEYDGADGQTTWSLTYVYAGRQRIGTLSWYGSGLPRNYWRHNDPVTGDEVTTVDNGEISTGTVFDPDGVDVGIEDPFPPLGEEEGVCVNYDPNYVPSGPEPPRINPLEGGSANCIIDGIEQRCNSVGSEAAVKCEDNQCRRFNPNARDGRGGYEQFHATSDGRAGYLALDAIPLGNGNYYSPSTGPRGDAVTSYLPRSNQASSFPQNPAPTTADRLRDFYRYQKNLAPCIWKVFSTDYQGKPTAVDGAALLGPQTLKNAPAIDTSRTKATMQALGSVSSGDLERGKFGTINMASDIGPMMNQKTREMMTAVEVWNRTYAHELGNLLGGRIAGNLSGSAALFGDPRGIENASGNYRDTDPGARLETCMFGGVAP